MNKKLIIILARLIIGSKTPIKADCGELCGAKCCGGGYESGMILLPGEDKLLKTGEYKIKKKTIGKEKVKFAVCRGSCSRGKRPFMCRIYPLLPYLNKDGTIMVIADPRAGYLCPLLSAQEYIDPDFKKAVKKASEILIRDNDNRRIFAELSMTADEYIKFTGN